MIKSWNQFNENRALYQHSLESVPVESTDNHLLYYAFDWDDNILNMPTVIHMDKFIDGDWVPTDVSTADFAVVRGDSDNWRILNGDPSAAFSEFRDNGPRGIEAFSLDVKKAITENRYAPAWEDFIECLTSGAIFAIITARGHEKEVYGKSTDGKIISGGMRPGIEYIIDKVLTDTQKQEMYNHLLAYLYMFKDENIDNVPKLLEDLSTPSKDPIVKAYLDNCDLVGVSAPSRSGSASNPEKAKEDALMQFADKADRFAKMVGKKAKIGFSDDDPGNVRHITDLAKNLHHERFANIISFTVKDTNKPQEPSKFVRTFDKFSEGIDPMQASTVSMRLPNAAMSGNRGGSDPYGTELKIKSKELVRISDEITDDELDELDKVTGVDISKNPKQIRKK
jgi:hypothetical protein